MPPNGPWLDVTRDATHRTLVGFSMGGALALALAADPEVRQTS
jgi:dienelactone hydrolase